MWTQSASDIPNKSRTDSSQVNDLQRDALIARSKVVLNMHYYEPGEFESVRVSYLWANRKCVVTEKFDVLYQALVPQCRFFVKHDYDREREERIAFEVFSQRSEVDILREALCGHL